MNFQAIFSFQVTRLTSSGILLRAYAEKSFWRLNAITDLILDSTELIASILEEPLPIKKIDFLIVKGLGSTNGIENSGLVILSEDYLTQSEDMHVTYWIIHEIVHQWIGNMVTVSNWSHICLQEDLAEFISLKALRIITASDSRYQRYRLSKYISIQLVETFISPNETVVLTEPVSLDNVNRRCYMKGVIFLESIESFIGEHRMLDAIQQFIAQYRLSTFDASDFIEAIAKFVVDEGVNMENVYEFWIRTGGFPAISMNMNESHIHLQQLSPAGALWPLPLQFENCETPNRLLITEEIDLACNETTSDLQLLNRGFMHFYRVNYDTEMWNRIQQEMQTNPNNFSPVERTQLISDFCYFNAEGHVPNGEDLRRKFIRMVYSSPEHYDLCEWYLYWCDHSKQDTNESGSEMVRNVLVDVVESLALPSTYACISGEVIKRANRLCEMLFSHECLL